MIEAGNESEKPGHVFHGYIEPDGQLFAHYHQPVGAARTTAYVICPPLGYEGVHCHHTIRILAERLAAVGLPVVRIHYHGTGESAGSDADPGRVSAWLSSIETAMDVLLDLDNVERVGLIGIRMGATLAAAVSSRRPVSDLVLWEPCVSGAMYVREMQILASATAKKLEASAGAVPDVPGVPDGLQAGGYLLTDETTDSLSDIKLEELEPFSTTRTLVVQRDDRPPNGRLVEQLIEAGFETEAEQIPGHKEMMAGGHPMSSVVPKKIVERIAEWTIAHSEPSRQQNESIPTLSGGALHGGLHRKIVHFGPENRLFGIITEPDQGSVPNNTNVILLSGGVVPRTAVNRAYVTLADRLAHEGHRVLRFDVSGIGESPPASENQDNEIFPTTLLPDAREAIDLVANSQKDAPLWLIGLCSGGANAFQTSLTDERVTGAVMINPAAFYWVPGTDPAATDAKQLAEAKRYGESMFSASSWKKLFSGRVNILHILSLLASRGRKLIAKRIQSVDLFGLKPAKGLAPDLRRLRERNVSVNLAVSPNDDSYALLNDLAGTQLQQLEQEGINIKIFQGADHTFNPFGARLQLVDWIAELLTSRTASE